MPYEPLCVLSMWDLTSQVGNKVIDYGLVLKTTMEIDFKKRSIFASKRTKTVTCPVFINQAIVVLGFECHDLHLQRVSDVSLRSFGRR